MWPARWKLISLWVSQVSRVTADNALRVFVCLEYIHLGAAQRSSGWHLVTTVFILPAILLAPFNGAVCNNLPKPRVLQGAALFGFLVLLVFVITNGPWLACWSLIAIGSAIYGPVRYAMLPAAADDTHWPLTRINAGFEMGAAVAIIAGMSMIPALESSLEIMYSPTVGACTILLLNGLAFLMAMFVAFPSDVRRHDSARAAVDRFFTDFRTIWNEREARICLLGLSGLRGLIIGMTGALLPRFLDGAEMFARVATVAGWVAGGMALGSLLVGIQKHPRRVLGFVPWGALGLSVGLLWAAADDAMSDGLCAFFGVMAGLVNVPLATVYQIVLPPESRGNGMAIRNMTDYLFTAVIAVALFLGGRYGGMAPALQLQLLAALAAIATIAAWWVFRRELVEQTIEVVFLVMYRFRAVGPGLDAIPLRGPVVVVANHSSWMDPMWLAKVVPRSVIPMMTSVFFDHWLLRWTMIYLADAIRVEASGFRREVPELQTAVATLDAGKCLVIFPEGRLRRSEEQPLKLFGQGVWRILCERPNTPVVICWMEGGWRGFFSYWKGPPTKNKRFDLFRPLGIAVGEPHVLSPEILADHRKARQYLMEQCGKMRAYLGLEPIQVRPAELESPEESP